MFNKLKAGSYQAKRAILEKAGKIEAHKEGPEFDAKVQSLFATHRAFINLRQVGKSIFDSKRKQKKDDPDAVVNPANLFLEQINEGLKCKKIYDKSRIAWETAKERAFNAAEAAKTPGKNQDKKDKLAMDLKTDEESKYNEYTAAKAALEEQVENLESQRDAEFEKAVNAMCTILTDLQPDWNQGEAPSGGGGDGNFAPPSGGSPQIGQPDNGGEPDAGENSAPVGEAVGGSPAVREATDSESD